MKRIGFVGVILLCICGLTGCRGGGKVKKVKENETVLEVVCKSEVEKPSFVDGVFRVKGVSEKTDTVFSCLGYNRVLEKGAIITQEMALKFGMNCGNDSTFTLFKVVKSRDMVIVCFMLEYSDLTEIIVNLYNYGGNLLDELKLHVDCNSDVVDYGDIDETLVQNSCFVALSSNGLSYGSQSVEIKHNVEADSYVRLEVKGYRAYYVYNSGRFVRVEDFAEFVERFHADSVFQGKRLAERVTGYDSDEEDTGDVSEDDRNYCWENRNLAVYLQWINKDRKTDEYKTEFVWKTETKVEEYIFIPESSSFYSLTFSLVDGKWMLTELVVNQL